MAFRSLMPPAGSDEPDLIVRSRRVVIPGGTRAAAIHIRDGAIASIALDEPVPAGAMVYDAGDLVVMPGLVDSHVHVNEPGRTEWEGFEHATRKAAAGGVTTLVDMPLNSIPATTSLDGFNAKVAAAQGKCWVDVGLWGGVVPGNTPQLEPLWNAGVLGFKCFLVPSGVDEFPHVTASDLLVAMPELARLNATLLVHAELPERITPVAGDPRRYTNYLRSRPPSAENDAIALMIRLARNTGARIHIVHLSSAEAVDLLRRARADRLPITVETCPHYLVHAAEDIPDGATEFKCAPPIRERANREQLWAALIDGVIDLIVTDHSPCPVVMKKRESGDFAAAWGGIASLGTSLTAVWTQLERRGGAIERLAEWMCAAPARLAGLAHRKGAISPGHDADLVVWDPTTATVHATFLRGRKIWESGNFAAERFGAILRR